jgi:hypothetical protein
MQKVASDAAAEASEVWFVGQRAQGKSGKRRERNRDKSLGITVYIGKNGKCLDQ